MPVTCSTIRAADRQLAGLAARLRGCDRAMYLLVEGDLTPDTLRQMRAHLAKRDQLRAEVDAVLEQRVALGD